MMLTRLIRTQLRVFAVLAAGSLVFTSVVYADLPRAVGLRGYDVVADFDDVSGLYPRAIVTYRGVQVGSVGSVDLDAAGARVVLALDGGRDIPADVQARIHSTSAIGEQFVDLVPADAEAPFLDDGAVIPRERTVEMPQIAPVLERLNTLLASVPADATESLLTQVDEGLAGAGPDLGEVVDQTALLLTEAQAGIDATTGLIDALDPLLAMQQELATTTTAYAGSLASFTATLAGGDASVRALLAEGPEAVGSLTRQLREVSPTLPVLLANLTTNGQVVTTYLPHLEQGLVTYPALLARLQSAVNPRAEQGEVNLDIKATVNDPASCVTGYVPPAERRVPGDTAPRAVDGEAHCQEPTSAPEGVRGLRNLPCPGTDGRRGATPAECGLVFPGAADADGRASVYVPYDPGTGELVAPDGQTYTIDDTTEGARPWTRLLTDPLGL